MGKKSNQNLQFESFDLLMLMELTEANYLEAEAVDGKNELPKDKMSH
jgi:hypothetical protein